MLVLRGNPERLRLVDPMKAELEVTVSRAGVDMGGFGEGFEALECSFSLYF
jgi:hypothetical protein